MCLVYWYTTSSKLGSSRHKNWMEGRSLSGTPTCKNIVSISAETSKACQRNLKLMETKFFNRSGPVNNDLFSEWPWKLAAPFSTRRTFPGLFGWIIGWCGMNHSRVEFTVSFLGSTYCHHTVTLTEIVSGGCGVLLFEVVIFFLTRFQRLELGQRREETVGQWTVFLASTASLLRTSLHRAG